MRISKRERVLGGGRKDLLYKLLHKKSLSKFTGNGKIARNFLLVAGLLNLNKYFP